MPAMDRAVFFGKLHAGFLSSRLVQTYIFYYSGSNGIQKQYSSIAYENKRLFYL